MTSMYVVALLPALPVHARVFLRISPSSAGQLRGKNAGGAAADDWTSGCTPTTRRRKIGRATRPGWRLAQRANGEERARRQGAGGDDQALARRG